MDEDTTERSFSLRIPTLTLKHSFPMKANIISAENGVIKEYSMNVYLNPEIIAI